MSEEKKKRNKIIGISIGILVVLLVVISSTYAYWQITKSQDGSNDIIAACLDIDMQSVDGTFGINPAWPISDEEGMNLTGYTFKVTNNCEEDVAYVIGMDSLEVNGVEYLDYSNIKISIDNNTAVIYESDDTEDIDHIEENDPYTIRDSKKINTAIVKGNTSNEHNVKVWIKSDAPVEEQSKVFSGRMFITGGQKIVNDKPLVQATPESCFEMNDEEIIGYDESCGDSVIIPATVNGVAVKTIDTNAFKEQKVKSTYYDINSTEVSPFDKSSAIVAVVLQNHEKGTAPDLANLLTNFDYAISYSDDADANSTILGMVGERPLYYENSTTQDFPGFKNKDLVIYMSDLAGSMLGMEYIELVPYVSINELDLSQAHNLKIIEEKAFTNVTIERSEFDEDYDFIDAMSDYQVSLNSLTFGENKNDLAIGNLAFARIEVDELILYSNYGIINPEEFGYYGGFTASNINKLTIKPTSEDKVVNSVVLPLADTGYNLYYSLYTGLYYKTLNIEEGIEEIDKYVFSGFNGILLNNNETINLPNSLKKIGDSAFYNNPSNIINLGTGLTNIGYRAFYGMTDSQVINVPMSQATFTSQTTLGDEWSGSATINYN